MTMKKLSLSALAASLLATAAIAAPAGQLFVDTNASTVASELLVDNNYTIGSTDVNATYYPKLIAGVQDGKLLMTFDGGTIETLPTAFVENNSTGEIVGINPQLAGADHQKLVFDINGTINDHDQLVLVNDDNVSTTIAGPDLNLTMNSSKISMKVDLLDNTDVVKTTSNQGEVASSSTEWGVSVGTPKFDGQIDAANSFKQFTTDGTDSYSSDVANIKVTNASVDVNTTSIDLNVTLLADSNISTYMNSIKFNGTSMTPDGMSGNKYVYKAVKTISAAGDYNVTLDSNGSTKIEKTSFTVEVSSDGTAKNTNFSKDYLTGNKFGAWTIYGYNAQIPNVRAKDGKFETYINVTNTSSIAADATFVIYPKLDDGSTNAGTTCSYNAGSIASNAQRKFTFSDILANSDCSEAVKAGVNFSLEFSVATEPNKVFANAYTKNIAVGGQFIVLPVYNTSDVNQ